MKTVLVAFLALLLGTVFGGIWVEYQHLQEAPLVHILPPENCPQAWGVNLPEGSIIKRIEYITPVGHQGHYRCDACYEVRP